MRALAALALTVVLAGCSKPELPLDAPSGDAELPITTTSAVTAESIRRGWDLLDTGRRAEARLAFEKASRSDPECAVALAQRAVLGGTVDGESLLRRAEAKTPSLREGERRMIETLRHTREGNPEAALATQKRIAELFPKAWRARYLAGRRLAAFRRFDEASAEIEAALALSPDQPAAVLLLGQMRLEQQRPDDGAALLSRYLELRPEDESASELLAVALVGAGDFAGAETAARRMLAIHPRSLRAREALGISLAMQGDWGGAFAEYDVIEASPEMSDVRFRAGAQRAWLLAGRGDIDAGLAHIASLRPRVEPGTLNAATIPAIRAALLSLAGRHREALEEAALSEASMAGGCYPKDPGCSEFVRRLFLRARIVSSLALGDDATASATASERTALRAFERGERERLAGRFEEAADELASCAGEDAWCALRRVEVAEAAGDADAVRAEARKLRFRDAMFLYVRVRLLSAD